MFAGVSNTFSNNNFSDASNLIINSTGLDFNNNAFGKGLNNSYLSSATSNNIESYFTGNLVEQDFSHKTIGLRCQNNNFGANFGNIADNYGNQIGNDFHENVIGNNFSGNVIGNWFYNNIVGVDFQENNLPYKFYSNTTGHTFKNWVCQTRCNGKDFSVGVAAATPADITKVIMKNESENVIFYILSSGTISELSL